MCSDSWALVSRETIEMSTTWLWLNICYCEAKIEQNISFSYIILPLLDILVECTMTYLSLLYSCSFQFLGIHSFY